MEASCCVRPQEGCPGRHRLRSRDAAAVAGGGVATPLMEAESRAETPCKRMTATAAAADTEASTAAEEC